MTKHISPSSMARRLSPAGLMFTSMAAFILLFGCQTGGNPPSAESRADSGRTGASNWRGVHVLVENDEQLGVLTQQLPKLAELGVNVLIAELDYRYDFPSHPEVRDTVYVTRGAARQFAEQARKRGIRVIPELDCLGHQSWSRNTYGLLRAHPDFDETPGQFPNNDGIYCRSWCPQNPNVNPVVFALIDDLVEAFQADAFHVGMDEVFLIGSEYCPRCRGGDPAKLFAKAVNDLHGHIVGKRKLQMLMWGDRLLDAKTMGYGDSESSVNHTSGAVDLIPKDIIICDWHYRNQDNYPSLSFFIEKGFRVWPSGWQPPGAAKAFSSFARQQKSDRLMGYLCNTWGSVKPAKLAEWPPLVAVLPDWK